VETSQFDRSGGAPLTPASGTDLQALRALSHNKVTKSLVRVLDFAQRYVSEISFAASANHRFDFEKRREHFIRTHNETLPVVAVCISNPDRSPVGINC
jgi:hypothetical protein